MDGLAECIIQPHPSSHQVQGTASRRAGSHTTKNLPTYLPERT